MNVEAMNKTINVILNGKNTTGYEGEKVLDLARRNGIEIPTLCHDPRLKPYTSCFVCVVEIEGMRGLQPSCSTEIAEGMNIVTDNQKVRDARRNALELIMSNHYADCVAPCRQTCPAGVDVQGYISLIEKGMYSEAIGLIKEVNPLPAICGRVCVRPCEVACRRNLMEEGSAVGIDYLKRFAADYDLESENPYKPVISPLTGKKVAIIGAGPGGLSAGWFLQLKGHQCDIYEEMPHAGGWLRYGIPEYRLPNDILRKEVDSITDTGVKIFCNRKLGDNLKYADLKKQYDAVILTIGSQRGTLLGCEGDDAQNVFSGIDFLKNMEATGQKHDFTGKTIAVVGGGNTAMDCCRTSMRCGAEKVYVVYRRTEKEMPANPIEIHESKLEGIEYMFLTNPVLVNKDSQGTLKSMTLIKMELGEPDSSGRRRPVPVEGSEFDMKVDYILAAIGQKTDVNFIDDINSAAGEYEFAVNRWGDIDADSKTLQTAIPSVFAAGDGVTGPATIIEAIAQAKTASQSCHQYLMGEEIKPQKKEFISSKDNFRQQQPDEYRAKFASQKRKEMPTLSPDARVNFEEVELGYADEKTACQEAGRCLECGCVEYFTCDLKKFSDDYNVDQKKYAGEFNEYPIDFSHPYIEIDNNKCILCARCIRICDEVVGAKALGLVDRGFSTFVAPSMGDSLMDTTCESCGLCISACPTAAISENTSFKPGPVRLDEAETICNYCSVGCTINLHHRNGFVMKTTGAEGLINEDTNICRYAKFGYSYINDRSRITKPLLREGNSLKEISFEKATKIIAEKIRAVSPDQNLFTGGARLSNEELYLVQRLARKGTGTNNINSFHYMSRSTGYFSSTRANAPFEGIRAAGRIFIIGSETNRDNAVAGFMINNARKIKGTPVELVTTQDKSSMEARADRVIRIKSYYWFIKALNHLLLSEGKENSLFIKDRCEEFDGYRESLLNENFTSLITKAGIEEKELKDFAARYNTEQNALIIFSEKEVSANCSSEIINLALVTGKLGKTGSGIIALKEKNNSHGIFDMGIYPSILPGGLSLNDEISRKKIAEKWGMKDLFSEYTEDTESLLDRGAVKNIFIFGEDPVGSAIEKGRISKWFSKAEFIAVQDYFMTETAERANLILPAAFPAETDGSFTNTGKVLQQYTGALTMETGLSNTEQIAEILSELGDTVPESTEEIMLEIISLLPQDSEQKKYSFTITDKDNANRLFGYGCDSVVKRFDKEFETALSGKKK